MKRLFYFILILTVFTSCEDIIDIEVPSEEPRLIVDALIRVNVADPFVNLRVKVSLTSPFFEDVPATKLKQISITNVDKPNTFTDPNYVILLETEPGIYERGVNQSFFTEGELILQIDHEDKIYLASTYFVSVNPMNIVEQVEKTDGNTEISVSFKDEDYQKDFYLFDFDYGNFQLLNDVNINSSERYTFSYLYDHVLEPGTGVDVSIMGIDRSFYNYMSVLLEQNNADLDLFSTPVATVRGNIINVTDIDNINHFDNVSLSNNFALGYFAVVQTFTKSIIIK